MRSAADSLHGATLFLPEVRHIEAAEGSELDALELSPEAPARIQLRGIGRGLRQMEPVGSPMGQELPAATAAMNRRASPPQHHAARAFPPQMFQTRDHGFGVDRVAWAVKIALARRR